MGKQVAQPHLPRKVHYSPSPAGSASWLACWSSGEASSQVMWRTEGTVKTASVPKAAPAAPNPRTARVPTTAATAPAAANATGPNANAPTMLNALTRDRACAGIRCCVTVASSALPSADPSPASSAPPATATTGRCRASASGGRGKPSVARFATARGRRGRRPSASRPPRIAPPP